MINRLSHSRLGNISFIALVTISYFVPRSLRSLVTKYDIVSRAIKLIRKLFLSLLRVSRALAIIYRYCNCNHTQITQLIFLFDCKYFLFFSLQIFETRNSGFCVDNPSKADVEQQHDGAKCAG